jgi:hypothetical protein
MVNNRRKWCCPLCSQTCSRHYNLKIHIERKHQGRGQPIREDGWHSISTNTSTSTHFIPDMTSLQNDNNYPLNQRYQQTLSSTPPYSKIEDTSKKRDPIDEFLKFWQPKIQQMKEILEIKNFKEFSSFSSSLQQRPNIVTGPVQAPIIRPIIPSPVTTTPLQQTQPAQSSQEQEQKKENINLLTTLITNLFITSTFQVEEFQRRARGVREDIIIDPPKLSSPTMITTTADYNNNNSKKREAEANPTIENTKKEELEQDRSDIEKYSSSKPNLLMDNEDEGEGDDNVLYFNDGKLIIMLDIGGYWIIKKNRFGDVIDASKYITDPLLEAQESCQLERKAAERMEQKRRAIEDLSYDHDGY